jgi:Domain of unknown function (DUF4360)
MLMFDALPPPPIAPDQVDVVNLVVSGHGCPEGSTSAYVTSDGLVLGLTFRELDAQTGPGIPPGRARESCSVMWILDHAPGWSYSIESAVYRGRADLAAGVTGEQTSTYWFPGETPKSRLSTLLTGPFFGPYTRTDEVAAALQVWSPCGRRRPLKIDVDLALTTGRPPGAGLMNIKYLDVSLEVAYGLTWKRC